MNTLKNHRSSYRGATLYFTSLCTIITVFFLFSCDLANPNDNPRTPKINVIRDFIQAGKTPPKSELGIYGQAIQDALTPIAGDTVKDLGIFFVSINGGTAPNRDGSTWEKAYSATYLKTAIDKAGSLASDSKPYLVVVGPGTYFASPTMSMYNNVVILGGLGKDGTLSSAKTIFDGRDSTRVFSNSNVNSTAVLYGVTIRHGRSFAGGGGMYNNASSPTIIRVIFSDNAALNIGGGGMYNAQSNPTLTQVIFSGNFAPGTSGGGLFNVSSSPTLIEVAFSNNSAGLGGGMFNDNAASSPTLTQVTFSNNFASLSGGGMYNVFGASPILRQVTFSNNEATNFGGGMFNHLSASPKLIQTTFFNNSNKSGRGGGGIYNSLSTFPTVVNSIFWGNTSAAAPSQIDTVGGASLSIFYSIVEGANDSLRFLGLGNVTQHGMVSVTDLKLNTSLGYNGGFVPSLALQNASPAIDAGIYVEKSGSNYYYSEDASIWYSTLNGSGLSTVSNVPLATTDLTAFDARGYAPNDRPDIGAYEYRGIAP